MQMLPKAMVNGRGACGDQGPLVFIMPCPLSCFLPPMTQSTCYHRLSGAVRLQEP